MEVTQRRYIYDREIDLIEKKRIVNQLDIVECINVAYVGSQSVPKGKTNTNAKQLSKWRRKKYRELNPKLYKRTLWDNIKRSGKIN
jgi:hypothetical protein